MKIPKIVRTSEKFLTDNSPVLLTAVGVAGVVSTAYLTGKASVKAHKLIEQEDEKRYKMRQDTARSRKDTLEIVWKLYIPAVTTGILTCTAIITANRIGTRRTAALAAAYTVSEKAFEEYRSKVVEKIGEKKEQQVRDEISQDRINRSEPNFVVVSESGKVLCHDAYSNQFFMSDMETLRKAQNDINAQILHADYATVSDLYSYIDSPGLEPTSVSGEMGWNTDKMLEMEFATILHKEKTPCISINFAVLPIRDPWRFC